MAKSELFVNTFGDWLEANGVTLHDVSEPPFTATIDLNALKLGVCELIITQTGDGEIFSVIVPPKLPTAARKVIDSWEGGDLAGAVNAMRLALEDFDADPVIQTHVYQDVGQGQPKQLVAVKTMRQVYEEIKPIIEGDPGADEYFNLSPLAGLADMEWPSGRVVVFAITGASEGHYVHVDVVGIEGDIPSLMLAKGFSGFDAAWALARRLARILGV